MASWDDVAERERKDPDSATVRQFIRHEMATWKLTQVAIALRAGVHPTGFANWLNARGRADAAYLRRIHSTTRQMALEMARKRLAERDPEFAEWDRQRQEATRGDGSITVAADADPLKDILP